ncbi:DUF3783 domain-containing protein [Thermococcus pacificus]|uniref:DUF3783 domain-containing protein n=1 Tax=Thermococcus pacificus TaxID=71998 RepID=A0A218P907_9EURY|nr:DUF3783 domain-containing protein [Thermococcus pacificus]ASJ07248.1 hypothetical protein A3L08_07905 [Thermococcus pacificus]
MGKVLLVGFSPDEAEAVRASLDGLGVFEVPEYCRDWVVSEIVAKAGELSGSSNWHLRKFVIMHGLSNEELKEVIRSVKALNPGRVIFATTTETALGWKLEDYLNELMEEDEYFQAMRWARREASQRKGQFLDIGKG